MFLASGGGEQSRIPGEKKHVNSSQQGPGGHPATTKLQRSTADVADSCFNPSPFDFYDKSAVNLLRCFNDERKSDCKETWQPAGSKPGVLAPLGCLSSPHLWSLSCEQSGTHQLKVLFYFILLRTVWLNDDLWFWYFFF